MIWERTFPQAGGVRHDALFSACIYRYFDARHLGNLGSSGKYTLFRLTRTNGNIRCPSGKCQYAVRCTYSDALHHHTGLFLGRYFGHRAGCDIYPRPHYRDGVLPLCRDVTSNAGGSNCPAYPDLGRL